MHVCRLYAYLNEMKTYRVDSYKSLIEYNPEEKTIAYRCKDNPEEYLNAKKTNGKWLDCGSNITKEKAEYFKHEASQKVQQLVDSAKKKCNYYSK